MPIYEYECSACGEQIEILKKMSDPDPKQCDKCQNGTLRKLMSKTSFVLKGGGWYSDSYDSKTQRDSKKAASTKKSEKDSSPSPSPKKEDKASKPAPAKSASTSE